MTVHRAPAEVEEEAVYVRVHRVGGLRSASAALASFDAILPFPTVLMREHMLMNKINS